LTVSRVSDGYGIVVRTRRVLRTLTINGDDSTIAGAEEQPPERGETMRGARRGSVAVLLSLGIAVAGTVALSQATATSATASCDYGWPYEVALPLAKAALVGRVLAVRHDGPDVRVTAVSVERVTGRVRGRQVGPTYRGEMIAGRCELPPKVGADVVVLLGVTDMGAPWGDDPYFVIGNTVSASQAAQIGGVPPTATAAPMAPVHPGSPAVPLAIVASLSFIAILRLLSRRTSRRASRSP
jgi:hypothetical protein